jgi:hypothetical protein
MRLAEAAMGRHPGQWPQGAGEGARPRAKPAAAEPPPPELVIAMTAFCDAAHRELVGTPGLAAGVARARGLRDPAALGLGHATPAAIEAARRELEGRGLEPEAAAALLVRVGALGVDKESGARYYRAGERLVLPERRAGGVVFYTARATGGQRAKYLHPPGLAKPLYGRSSLYRPGSVAFLTEGPFDALPLIEAGAAAAASMGCEVNDAVILDVARAAAGKRILVAFDADETGRAKGARAVEALRARGLEAEAAPPPPPYKDYGEWAAAEGAAAIVAAQEAR